MAERRIVYLAVVCGSLVFFWAYREWLSWIILMIVVLLPWMSLLLSWQAMRKLELLARCPEAVRKGQTASITLASKCALPHPPVKGRVRVQRAMTGETWTLRNGAALPVEHCAKLTVEPVKAWAYDYLGLFRRRIRLKQACALLVRPEPVLVENPPDLSRYLASSWKPKPGGGYAENHELRLYRPGDNLHQIHWKLSAKTGKLILREPMEPLKGLAVLTMELNGTLDQIDRKLGKLHFLSAYLIGQGVPHQIHCLTGQGIQICEVRAQPDVQAAVDALLGAPMAAPGEKIDFVEAAWRYHVGGDAHEA